MGKANEVETQPGPGTAPQRLVEMVEYQDCRPSAIMGHIESEENPRVWRWCELLD